MGFTIKRYRCSKLVSIYNFFVWKSWISNTHALPIISKPRKTAFVTVTVQTEVVTNHQHSYDFLMMNLYYNIRFLQ